MQYRKLGANGIPVSAARPGATAFAKQTPADERHRLRNAAAAQSASALGAVMGWTG